MSEFPVVVGAYATTSGENAYKKSGGEWVEVELGKLDANMQAALMFWGEHAEYAQKTGAQMQYTTSFASIPAEQRSGRLANLVPRVMRSVAGVAGTIAGSVGYHLVTKAAVPSLIGAAQTALTAYNPMAGAAVAAIGTYFSAGTGSTWADPPVQIGRCGTTDGTTYVYRGEGSSTWQPRAPITIPTDMIKALQYWGKLAQYARTSNGQMSFVAKFAGVPTLKKKQSMLSKLVPAGKTFITAAGLTVAGRAANDATQAMIKYANGEGDPLHGPMTRDEYEKYDRENPVHGPRKWHDYQKRRQYETKNPEQGPLTAAARADVDAGEAKDPRGWYDVLSKSKEMRRREKALDGVTEFTAETSNATPTPYNGSVNSYFAAASVARHHP